MMPLEYPGAMSMFGSTIEVRMNPASLSFSESSRFGPTWPVAFAASSVWQAAHPDDVKTVLPAAASPVGALLVVVWPVDVVDADVVGCGPASPPAASDSAANFS